MCNDLQINILIVCSNDFFLILPQTLSNCQMNKNQNTKINTVIFNTCDKILNTKLYSKFIDSFFVCCVLIVN